MIPPLQLGASDYEAIGMTLAPIVVAFGAWMSYITVQVSKQGIKLDLIMDYFNLKPRKKT